MNENKNEEIKIYSALSQARLDFQAKRIKKSGRNTYVGFDYYELTDIISASNQILFDNKLLPIYNLYEKYAILTLITFDGLSKLDFKISLNNPNIEAHMGDNAKPLPIQRLGSIMTYTRRYLYMAMLEISEPDSIDSLDQKNKDIKETTRQDKKTEERTDEQKEVFLKYAKAFNIVNKKEYEQKLRDFLSKNGLLLASGKTDKNKIMHADVKDLKHWTNELLAMKMKEDENNA